MQSAAGYIVIFDVTSPWKMNKFKRCEGHQVTENLSRIEDLTRAASCVGFSGVFV